MIHRLMRRQDGRFYVIRPFNPGPGNLALASRLYDTEEKARAAHPSVEWFGATEEWRRSHGIIAEGVTPDLPERVRQQVRDGMADGTWLLPRDDFDNEYASR